MPCEFLIGHACDGVVVRLVGRGTMNESSAFHAAVEPNLSAGVVVFDATHCDYLDSTFLGCLVGIKKASASIPDSRFVIVAPPAIRAILFSSTSLDHYFDFVDDSPQLCDEFTPIAVPALEADDLGNHVMHCHKRLAAMGGNDAPAFQAVVDRLAAELGKKRESMP